MDLFGGDGECGADAIASPVPTPQGLPRHQLGQHLPRPEFKKQVDQGCELLGILRVPERPANLTFGGPDGRTLYVTARSSVYAARMLVPGRTPVLR